MQTLSPAFKKIILNSAKIKFTFKNKTMKRAEYDSTDFIYMQHKSQAPQSYYSFFIATPYILILMRNTYSKLCQEIV